MRNADSDATVYALERFQMSKIELIEQDIQQLDDTSFAAFREWFLAYENARWDNQIEKDSNNGKLDSLIDDAVAAHRTGKSTPL